MEHQTTTDQPPEGSEHRKKEGEGATVRHYQGALAHVESLDRPSSLTASITTGMGPSNGARLVDALVKAEPGPDHLYSYDRRATQVLSIASGWSYAHPQTMVNVMTEHGFPHVDYVHVDNRAMLIDVNAYFLRSACGRLGILVFRGTEPSSIVDWLTNASVRVRPFREIGSIHGGLGLSLACVWPAIAEKVNSALEGKATNGEEDMSPMQALYVTGHSLGAALAALATAVIFSDPDCVSWRKRFRGLYTFGQPMVGDAIFANQCESRFGVMTFRHVYGNDLVARMPPRSTGPFKHFGEEYTNVDDRWTRRAKTLSQAYTQALRRPLGAVGWVTQQLPQTRWLRLPFSVDDHGCLNYIHVSNVSAEDPVFR